VGASPLTIASGRPVRRSKLSAKKRAIASAGCVTLRSVPAVHGRRTIIAGTRIAGMIINPAQA
jgi:hypothetical protein